MEPKYAKVHDMFIARYLRWVVGVAMATVLRLYLNIMLIHHHHHHHHHQYRTKIKRIIGEQRTDIYG